MMEGRQMSGYPLLAGRAGDPDMQHLEMVSR